MTNLSQVRKITFCALLLALAIVFTIVAKMITISPFPYLRFSLTPSIIVFGSIFLGPFYGAIIGIGSDLIPAFLYSTGSYNFFVTIVYALLGVLPWLLSKFTRRFKNVFALPWPFIVLLLLSLSFVAWFFFGTSLLDEGFGENALAMKLIVYGVTLAVDAIGVVLLFLFNAKIGKKHAKSAYFPQAFEIGAIVSVLEMVLMVLLKSLAFYAFFYINDSTPPFSYWYLFSMLIMGSGANIAIMIFVNMTFFGLIEGTHGHEDQVGKHTDEAE